MATGRNDILAVIDPTHNEQWALQKAVSLAKNRENSRVFAFLCAYSEAEYDDPEEYQSVEIKRHQLWLADLIANLDAGDVEILPLVQWGRNWREAIVDAAIDAEVRLVVKRASGRPELLASSDRELIRKLKSALLLVKHPPARDIHKVLVAIDFNATDEGHLALNEAIIDLGRRIRGSNTDIDLHAVCAYPESDKFVHPPDVARNLEIDRSRAHVRQGKAAEVIPAMANEIDADLVVVGNVGRRGFAGITIGNTSEKILTDIQADVLVLVKEENAERSAA